jgi:hypothetical protein
MLKCQSYAKKQNPTSSCHGMNIGALGANKND